MGSLFVVGDLVKIQPSQKEIIQELEQGNQRFLAGESLQTSDQSLLKLKEYARTGQRPKAIILCCSDSRAPVEMIFDQDLGDLFVIRVAGNIVAPSLVGSVEFAVSTFGTEVVLVMGHSQCGAISATLNQINAGEVPPSENLHDIVGRIRPHIYSIAKMEKLSVEEKMNLSIEANVMASVAKLSSSSRIIEDLVQEHKLAIFGAVLELSSGRVRFLDQGN